MIDHITANLICPHCDAQITEEISPSACVVSYKCPACGQALTPTADDGCVFCSYSDVAVCIDTEECNCARCLPDSDQRFHVVLGVSPFNSYYNERRLSNLLTWSASHFKQTDVFIPDTPTIWTLEAGGYPLKRATHKTKRQIRYLTNKVTRAIESTDDSHQIAVLPWSVMSEEYDTYHSLYERCKAAFTHDTTFRHACLDATEEVMENRSRDTHEPSTSDRLRAVDYLMAELPIILFAPELFDVPTSTFVYHRSLPLFEKLFANDFLLQPNPGQHFVVAHE
ncbi:MAG: tRNA-dependent cyclodipeptide synthase [Balneolales bacterium]